MSRKKSGRSAGGTVKTTSVVLPGIRAAWTAYRPAHAEACADPYPQDGGCIIVGPCAGAAPVCWAIPSSCRRAICAGQADRRGCVLKTMFIITSVVQTTGRTSSVKRPDTRRMVRYQTRRGRADGLRKRSRARKTGSCHPQPRFPQPRGDDDAKPAIYRAGRRAGAPGTLWHSSCCNNTTNTQHHLNANERSKPSECLLLRQRDEPLRLPQNIILTVLGALVGLPMESCCTYVMRDSLFNRYAKSG